MHVGTSERPGASTNWRNLDMHMYNQLKPAKSEANQRGLKIIFRPRAELKPDPANPRQHSRKQVFGMGSGCGCSISRLRCRRGRISLKTGCCWRAQRDRQ